jgi:hypothetical protein
MVRMSTFREMVKRRALAVPVGIMILAVAGTGVALAVSSPSPGEPAPPLAETAPVGAVEAGLGSQLGVLRRSQTAADAVPGSIPIVFSQASGANLSLARHVGGQDGSEAWVIPGRGTVCILARQAEDGLGGAVCTSTAAADAGGLNVQLASDKLPGGELLAGVVPDGVGSVTVTLAGGGTTSIPVHENVYTDLVHGAVASVTATAPKGAALSIPSMSASQQVAASQ